MATNESTMEELLAEVLEENGMEVRSFDDAGLMTRNKGVVVRLEDGSEFQIAIVKSR